MDPTVSMKAYRRAAGYLLFKIEDTFTDVVDIVLGFVGPFGWLTLRKVCRLFNDLFAASLRFSYRPEPDLIDAIHTNDCHKLIHSPVDLMIDIDILDILEKISWTKRAVAMLLYKCRFGTFPIVNEGRTYLFKIMALHLIASGRYVSGDTTDEIFHIMDQDNTSIIQKLIVLFARYDLCEYAWRSIHHVNMNVWHDIGQETYYKYMPDGLVKKLNP